MRHHIGLLAIMALTFGLSAGPAQAGLIGPGRTVQASYDFGSTSTAAVEPEINIATGTSAPASLTAPVNYQEGADDLSLIAVNDTSIAITNLAATGTTYCFDGTSVGSACTDPFDGFVFNFTGEDITGVSVDPATSPGFTLATFGAHKGLELLGPNALSIDLTGADPAQNGTLLIDLSFGTPTPPPVNVPEPASLGLLGMALLGLTMARRGRG